MKYLTEMHCHTKEVSKCANVPACEVVEKHIEAGYSTVVITDHFSEDTFWEIKGEKWEYIATHYLKGYREALKCAKGRINILLGMELRFYEGNNDYLVYGLTEELLLQYPNLMAMGLKRFSKVAAREGLMLFQAHPFRYAMSVVDPLLLDGVETYNGNARHDSRNDITNAWADKFNLKKVSGSDFHEYEDLGRGGIITDFKIQSNNDLLKALRSGVELKVK